MMRAVALLLWFSCALAPVRGQGGRAPSRRAADRLRVGTPAPDFRLRTLDGNSAVRLASYRGKKPVALVFGSYT
jgi:hypothetical protein